ncbi:MAG: ABC transporter substrate-binding protein [Armatimonadetes bacterium]|nr:ABC transporter substrate-binding protein [Armatimonadota bacterium]
MVTPQDTLVMGYSRNLSGFIIHPLRVKPAAGPTRWMYSALVRFDERVEHVGDLAEGWEVSPDGCTYTFHLRKDVRWHDGHPFTAADVVYTAERMLDPATNFYFRNVLIVDGEPAKFTSRGEHTVQVRLAKPYAPLLSHLTPAWGSMFSVVPRHILERDGDDAFEQHPVGTGPFKFGGTTRDGALALDANPQYFRGAPKLARVLVRFIPDNEERVQAFRDGQVDALIWPGRHFTDEEARRHGGRFYSVVSNTVMQWAPNHRRPLFGDRRLRQALAHAIDKEAVVRAAVPDAVIAHSPIGPACWAHEPDVPIFAYDPQKAAGLLDEAGWRPGAGGIRTRDGQPLRLSVIYSDDPWRFDLSVIAQGLRRNLRAVGVDLEVKPVTYWGGMKPAWRAMDFDTFIFYDTFYAEPDLYWSWHSAMPRRPKGPGDAADLPQYGYGVTGYANPEADRLIVAARHAPDRAERRRLLSQAQKLMAEDVASFWLYYQALKIAVRDSVKGLSEPTIADPTHDLIVFLHPEQLYKVA